MIAQTSDLRKLGGGSDVASLRTTARREGDEYVVDGTKTFITSGARADFVTTAVRTGGPHEPGRGHAGISLLVVETDRPGFTVDRRLRTMGWHCSDTAELGYAGVRVPAANLVGEEGDGFAQIAQQFVTERIVMSVFGYGIASRSLELAASYTQQRETATYVCDAAVQLHGGTGYLHGTEVERHYRDARILPIGGGATEVLTDLAARLLGYAP